MNTYFPWFYEERWRHLVERLEERKRNREEAEQLPCDVCGQLGARYHAMLDLRLCRACFEMQGGA